MNIQVRKFSTNDSAAWDELVNNSWNGTFLHSRRFLSYHGDRFADMSVVIEDEKHRLIGILPAAIDPSQGNQVINHPGITYGGIVHNGELRGARMVDALATVCQFYRENNFRTLIYKPVPYIYHRVPANDDLYALFRISALRYRCELSATIDNSNRTKLSKGRKYCIKKAIQNGVSIHSGIDYLTDFWIVLQENLWNKYQLRPVHSLNEIINLYQMFPENIECIVGVFEDKVISGIILFKTNNVIHSQYIAANQKGNELFARDLVIESCISRSREEGFRYFNFGVSTEDEGRYLNEGLHRFKLQFGSGGVVHEFYKISLV